MSRLETWGKQGKAEGRQDNAKTGAGNPVKGKDSRGDEINQGKTRRKAAQPLERLKGEIEETNQDQAEKRRGEKRGEKRTG